MAEAVGATNGDEYLAIRPEHVVLDAADPDTTATVKRVIREDATSRVVLSLGGAVFDAYSTTPPETGPSVGVRFSESNRSLL
ncbi:TOBE domain-containing protein [Haloarculaceae archaeon H-GB11]|nr:TOBE domain-containing protein [Haloarculaceae archaeon H-GB11]